MVRVNHKVYFVYFAPMELALARMAVKLANRLVKNGLYKEHVAVPTAINAVKNWSGNGWI